MREGGYFCDTPSPFSNLARQAVELTFTTFL